MENMIKMFDFKTNNVSCVLYQDKIYLFPEEIGEILGFEDLSDSIQKSYGLEDHYDFEVFRGYDLKNIKALIGTRGSTFPDNVSAKRLITESGLYALIMRSIKPDAREFRKWVTSEVLPSIRKTGAYVTEKTTEDWLANPDMMIKALQELKRAREEKAWISSRREATAMQTASVKARECSRLEKELEEKRCELGLSKKYASTISVSKLTGHAKDIYPWYPLKKYCVENALEIKKEFNAAYGTINTYPAEAWLKIYSVSIDSIMP